MEDRLCQKHEAEIKTLFENDKELGRRVNRLEEDKQFIFSLDKSLALQSQILMEISEHNKRQDSRMDEYQEIIVKVNHNLSELATAQKVANEELKSLGGRIDTIEEKVDENESKHSIDLRVTEKSRYEKALDKFIAPVGWGALLAGLWHLVQSFM